MKTVYSTRGEFSAVLKEIKPPLLAKEAVDIAHKILVGLENSHVKILEKREISELGKSADPQKFLLLRDLSVYLKKAYESISKPLIEAGFSPRKRVLLRFPKGVSALEVLAAGVSAGVSSVPAIFSFSEDSLTPEICASLRLSGADFCYVSDGVDAVREAIFPRDKRLLCDTIVGSGDEEFLAAASLAQGIEKHTFPEKRPVVYAAFDGAEASLISADIACGEKCELPILITQNEALSHEISAKFNEINGFAVISSSEEESLSIVKKCTPSALRIYGNSPTALTGINADRVSPLMARASSPMSVYPYSPSQLLSPPKLGDPPSVICFATAISKYVERGTVDKEEVYSIGERMQRM